MTGFPLSACRWNEAASGHTLTCDDEGCDTLSWLRDAGCCDPEGCVWRDSCIQYESPDECVGICQPDSEIFDCSDPARGYCQPAALDSESESRLFTCTSAVFDRQINLPSRRDHLDTAGFDPSSYRTDSHTFELKSKRSALHQYPKRYTYTTVGGVLGSIFFLIIAGIVFFLIFRRRRRVIYPAAPAASAAASSSANATGNTATTNVYVMGSQQQPMPQQQQPITMQPIIPAQPYPPQQQTVYSNSPPPQQEYSYATTNAIHAPANPSYNSYPPPQPQPQAYPNVITPAPAPGPSEPLPTYKDQSKM